MDWVKTEIQGGMEEFEQWFDSVLHQSRPGGLPVAVWVFKAKGCRLEICDRTMVPILAPFVTSFGSLRGIP